MPLTALVLPVKLSFLVMSSATWLTWNSDGPAIFSPFLSERLAARP